MAIDNAIRQARLSKGWSQATLASRSGLTLACIAQIEQCRRKPMLITLYRIARALGVSMDSLVNDKGSSNG